jgi:hypothetical protein
MDARRTIIDVVLFILFFVIVGGIFAIKNNLGILQGVFDNMAVCGLATLLWFVIGMCIYHFFGPKKNAPNSASQQVAPPPPPGYYSQSSQSISQQQYQQATDPNNAMPAKHQVVNGTLQSVCPFCNSYQGALPPGQVKMCNTCFRYFKS